MNCLAVGIATALPQLARIASPTRRRTQMTTGAPARGLEHAGLLNLRQECQSQTNQSGNHPPNHPRQSVVVAAAAVSPCRRRQPKFSSDPASNPASQPASDPPDPEIRSNIRSTTAVVATTSPPQPSSSNHRSHQPIQISQQN